MCNLSELCVGDEVFYIFSHFSPGMKLTIDKITDKTIICKGFHNDSKKRFRKSDGTEIGNHDINIQPFIKVITEEIRAELRRSEILLRLRSFSFKDLSLEKLELIDKTIRS